MPKLAKIFTPLNLALIKELNKEKGSVRELAERIGCSPGKIHQGLTTVQELIIEERIKNRRIISLDTSKALTKQIKSLLNLNSLLSTKAVEALKKEGKLLLYGSYARGEDDGESDIDLLLLSKKSEMELRQKIRTLEQEMERKVSLLIMNQEELERLKMRDPEFTSRVQHAIIL